MNDMMVRKMYDKDDIDRYTPVYGPNSKQWWVYDECKDVYIDPPAAVLDRIRMVNAHKAGQRKTAEDWDIERREMLKEIEIALKYDDWLLDEEYWYADIEI